MVDKNEITISIASLSDIDDLYSIKSEVAGYFEKCLQEQEDQKRSLYIAYIKKEPMGYIQLIFCPVYALFKKLEIPEIQDLYVSEYARNFGVGNNLVAHCENIVKNFGSSAIGIGVGLTKNYGAAQRLYSKRGYVPDGMGVVYDNNYVTVGQVKAIDDFLCLKMIKKIS